MCFGVVPHPAPSSPPHRSVSYAWDLLGFLDLWVYSFHEIWNFSAPVSSDIIFVLPPYAVIGKLYQGSKLEQS